MLEIETSHIYKKGYKWAIKRGLPIDKLNEVVMKLANQELLPAKYKRPFTKRQICWLSRMPYSTRLASHLPN